MNQTYVNIGMWFRADGFRLDEEKTKVMFLFLVHHYPTTYSVNIITPSDSACLLGVTIDKQLNWFEHIKLQKLSSFTFLFRVLVLVV